MGPPPPGAKKRRVGAGLSVDKFATGRRSTYDPRVAKEKEQALAANRVNKYRKLKAKVLASLPPKLLPTQYDDVDVPQERGRRKKNTRAGGDRDEKDTREDAEGSTRTGSDEGESGGEEERREGERRQASEEAGPPAGGDDDAAARQPAEEGRVRAGAVGGEGSSRKVYRDRFGRPRPPTQLERLAEKASKEKAEREAARKLARAQAANEAAARERARKRREEGRNAMRKRTRGGQPVMKVRLENVLQKLEAGR